VALNKFIAVGVYYSLRSMSEGRKHGLRHWRSCGLRHKEGFSAGKINSVFEKSDIPLPRATTD